jgi:hypothetical protein
MVYSSPLYYEDDNPLFSTQAGGGSSSNGSSAPTKPVRVFYNGTGLDDIAGPVPMVDLSTIFNRSEAGTLFSITTKVTLNGKILRAANTSGTNPDGTGTAVILDAAQKMTDLFSQSGLGTFQIKCGNNNIIEGCGVKVNSFALNKSNDNWIFSADYSIDLEYSKPGPSGQLIKNGSDSWSLEPMEEYVYASFAKSVTQKSEYHNPLLNPPLPAPGASNGSSNTSAATLVPSPSNPGEPSPYGTSALNFTNIPQFKLSRRISAEGISGPSGTGCGVNVSAYLNAKNWVAERVAQPYGAGNTSSSSGISFGISANPNISNFSNLFLYNHLRTISFSETAGSYEVNETWLAMPTGIRYVEDYTVEASTDERFVRTVRVQGSVKGLMISPFPIMSGASGLVPTTGKIDLSPYLRNGESGTISQKILDSSGLTVNSNDQYFYGTKYENALSGWLNDIKPYLYRRASFPINLERSTDDYVSLTTSPQPPPLNPTYCKQKLLNIIPVSTNEGHDSRKGTISYSYEFNDRFRFISGVLAENISINQTGPVDVINEAFVLGRRLGPVLQSLGAKTSAKKDLTFEIIVVPPSSFNGFMLTSKECPLWTGGTTYKTIQEIIEGFKPFGDRRSSIFGTFATRTNDTGQVFVSQDNSSWNPTEGRYTRTIGWVYQTCNLSRSYLDD